MTAWFNLVPAILFMVIGYLSLGKAKKAATPEEAKRQRGHAILWTVAGTLFLISAGMNLWGDRI